MLLPLLLISSGFRFRGIGDFYLGEIYSTIFFFSHFLTRNVRYLPESKIPRSVKTGFLLWFSFVFISSILHKSSVRSLVIACLTIFISFTLLYSFLHTFKLGGGVTLNLQYLLVGQVFAAIVQPYNLGTSNGWKFQYGLPLSALLISFLFQQSRLLGIVSAFVLSFISFNYSARNLAISILLGGFIGLSQELTKKKKLNLKAKFNSIFIFIFISFSVFSYFAFAKSGFLGEREKIRLEKLVTSNQVVIASRPEIFFTTVALKDSPLLGYGSALSIDESKLRNIATMARDTGLIFQGLEKSAYEIPVHSYIMGSMLRGGLASGFFWFWCFVVGLRCLVRNLFVINPAEAILVTSLLWSIWFSPYGASARMLSMYAVYSIIQLNYSFAKRNHTPN
jgi:hypothetical protein